MKKKLNYIISLLLILAISVCSFITPASSFENNEVTSSRAMLLINLNTDTTVYAQNADRSWFASYLSELMTYRLMTEKVKEPEKTSVLVDEDFINDLERSDHCLDRYLGDTLTMKDLAAIMLLTSGSDAAYLIADKVSGGNVDAFVKEMNGRAAQLGCKLTKFASPGYNISRGQTTSCQDLALIYRSIYQNDLYQEIMSSATYIPEKYGENKAYAVTTENSIHNPTSPYYFRYVTGGKYSYDKYSGAGIVVTTSYKDMDYLFVALHGKNEAEENVFADARRMTTWAYLSLSDRKVIDTDEAVDSAAAVSSWGEYQIKLYADNSARKTLPNEYEISKFSVKMDVPDSLKLPLFQGEVVGSAEIYYDKEKLDKVRIVPNHDEGVSLVNDLGRFGGYALAKMFPNNPAAEAASPTEPATQPATAAPTKKPAQQKATKPAETKPTEAPKSTEVPTAAER